MTQRTLLASLVLFGAAAGTAQAADLLGTEALRALLTGNTLYVEVPPGAPGAPEGGTAPIYYAADGAATAQLPAGLKLVGAWSMKEGHYCIDWDNGPKNSCTTIARGADAFLVLDQATGDPRGRVARIATGNPENL